MTASKQSNGSRVEPKKESWRCRATRSVGEPSCCWCFTQRLPAGVIIRNTWYSAPAAKRLQHQSLRLATRRKSEVRPTATRIQQSFLRRVAKNLNVRTNLRSPATNPERQGEEFLFPRVRVDHLERLRWNRRARRGHRDCRVSSTPLTKGAT